MIDFTKSVPAHGYDYSKFQISFFLITNLKWIKYIFKWRNSLKSTVDDFSLDIYPWYTYGAIDWVQKNIKKDAVIFEYGSGGSTLYYSMFAKELISIEHNKEWFMLVQEKIKNKKNIKLILKEPRELQDTSKSSYKSETFNSLKTFDFENYVNSIEDYPEKYFDLISIDGRCRPMCLLKAASKIKNGGYLILDNSERSHYQDAMNSIVCRERLDFFGFGPKLKSFWRTTIWKM